MRIPLLMLLALAAGCAEHGGGGHRSLDDLVKQSPKAAVEAEAAQHAPAHAAGVDPLEALTRLSTGNARFATAHRSRSATAADDAGRRAATTTSQHPFAVVITCADSRVTPELLFDQSIGDIFVIRNAGNIAEPVCAGSVEYAVEHLDVRLVVMLGHASCGAVTAVVQAEGQLPGHLADIQKGMPGLRDYAIARSTSGRSTTETIADAVARNASDQAMALLTGSPSLRQATADGRLAVVPAVYDLATGVVGFLTPVAAPAAAGH